MALHCIVWSPEMSCLLHHIFPKVHFSCQVPILPVNVIVIASYNVNVIARGWNIIKEIMNYINAYFLQNREAVHIGQKGYMERKEKEI